jgi:hypothetical protein
MTPVGSQKAITLTYLDEQYEVAARVFEGNVGYEFRDTYVKVWQNDDSKSETVFIPIARVVSLVVKISS